MRLLEVEGLIDVVSNRGPFVASLPPAEASRIYEARAVLEALAGQGFSDRAYEDEIAELRAVFEEITAARPGMDRVALRILNQQAGERTRAARSAADEPGPSHGRKAG